MNESFQSMLSLIISDGILGYFMLINYSRESGSKYIYLEEIYSIPTECQSNSVQSKGFCKEIILQDFPRGGNCKGLVYERKIGTYLSKHQSFGFYLF